MRAIGLSKPRGAVKAKGRLSALGTILYRRSPAISNHPRMLGIRRAHVLRRCDYFQRSRCWLTTCCWYFCK